MSISNLLFSIIYFLGSTSIVIVSSSSFNWYSLPSISNLNTPCCKTISVSGLQFEGATIDKKANEELAKQYQQEQTIEMITSSVIPLLVVLVLGCFALLVLKGFVSKIPTPKPVERKVQEELPRIVEEEEVAEVAPRIKFNEKEIQSQKEQTITEINEAVLAAPEDAAKLLTSFIRE